jgi:DNA-binding MarR family transcriptional regulator
VGRDDLGFLLAKASQRWNELLAAAFADAGYGDVRPSYGSILVPLYEEDGLQMGDLARRARLSKQTITSLVRRLEADGFVTRSPDPDDARASRIFLTQRARRFEPVAAGVMSQLERLARRELGPESVAELKDALRDLLGLTSAASANRSRRTASGR